MSVNTGHWNFPDTIEFEMAPRLARSMQEFDKSDVVIFDLSNTTTFHASFIGLLIHMKNTFENQGRKLLLRTSPDVDRVFGMLHLHGFFSNVSTEKNN